MPERAPADPVRFKEASDWFRSRLPVTQEQWDGMRVEARRQAFVLSGVQQLDAVQTVMELLQESIDNGTPIDEWRAKVKQKLGEFGPTGSQLTTSFINAHQTAYNTGRWYQLSEPSVTSVLPFRIFDAVMDGRETPICHACNGTILPHDDPWWNTHWCPCHHRCRSTIRALSARMAARRGGQTQELPRPKITGDFGLAPPLRDKWEPDLTKYESHLSREYLKKQKSMKAANDNGDPLPRPKRKK